MTQYAFSPARVASLPVRDSDVYFPLRRVYCVGRNYASHTREMGGNPDREAPFFFQKNPGNLDTSGEFPYPAQTDDVHHEVELLVALSSGGSDISVDEALTHVYGHAVALDMTRRDLQATAKAQGRPWELSKAFERSAPCSAITPVSATGHLMHGLIELQVNGRVRQSGNLDQMIWTIPEIIATLSRYIELAAGDVILTGTPSGVSAVARGDQLEAMVESVGTLSVVIT